MNNVKNQPKSPVTQENIYKLMLIITIGVGALFLIKNLISKSIVGAVTVGISIGVFAVIMLIMHRMKFSQYIKQFVVSIALIIVATIISLNSGNFYSDDFPLFLAIIALSGMYLEPMYTMVQTLLTTIIFVILYLVHPEKADPLSQYIMCVVIFDLCAFLMMCLINRGRAFINMSQIKADEAASLVESMTNVGKELENNYQNSSQRLTALSDVNEQLENNASELKRGSEEISRGTTEVEESCNNAQKYVQISGEQINALNSEVKNVETALAANKQDIQEMDQHFHSVKVTLDDINAVFAQLLEHVKEISTVTEQLTTISNSTKMLALNASIESARAGEAGKGFSVVANKVQDLAVDSNACSEQVVVVVNEIKNKIELTTARLEESTTAINDSLDKLSGLETGFDGLITQFESLYSNIEAQNDNVNSVNSVFDELKEKIAIMSTCSRENQSVVNSIVDAMSDYKDHITQVVDDTKQIHELSASMMENS